MSASIAAGERMQRHERIAREVVEMETAWAEAKVAAANRAVCVCVCMCVCDGGNVSGTNQNKE